MLAIDDKGNLIEVCLFESFLAKYFLDNPVLFQPLLRKLFTAIEGLIVANAETPMFDRMLFSVRTSIATQDRSAPDFESLKQSSSLITMDTFFKYLVERVMFLPAIKIPSLPEPAVSSGESQVSFFKGLVHRDKAMLSKMRPKVLFLEKNRGVIALEDSDGVATTNIGILSEEHTPKELVNYLQFENFPSRQFYQPNEDSMMALWLREHHLPVISGASGSIGKTVSALARLVNFSINEYKLLGLLITSSTIALGHHSFFEVIRPLTLMIGQLQEQDNLLAFYEQVIPEEVKASDSYQEHMHSEYGACLIETLVFDHSTALSFG